MSMKKRDQSKEELLQEVETLRKRMKELEDAASERDRVETELRERELKYRKIFENLQDIFYQVDISGKIIDVSPSVFRFSGYTREELIGKSVVFSPEVGKLFCPADVHRHIARLAVLTYHHSLVHGHSRRHKERSPALGGHKSVIIGIARLGRDYRSLFLEFQVSLIRLVSEEYRVHYSRSAGGG